MNRPSAIGVALLSLAAVGCSTDGKGTESPLPGFGAADSFFNPTEMGVVRFPSTTAAEIGDEAQFHSFRFTLAADASVRLESIGDDGSMVDTVFYLYREGERGWGSYFAKDDDGGENLFSVLDEELGGGNYRLIVKGYSDTDRGRYRLQASCEGEGCVIPLSDNCLFGETYYDYVNSPNFEVVSKETLTASSELSELTREQILATMDAYGESLSDVAEVYDVVDQGELFYSNRQDVFDGSRYTAIEFGAGDNSFGAILYAGTTKFAAIIGDGDLYGCEVFEPANRWNLSASETANDDALAEAFPGRLFSMQLESGHIAGQPLAMSTYDDLVDAALEVVSAQSECLGFPSGEQTDVEDNWDPWYVDQWMGAAHVQNGWEDAPTPEQRATLQAYFDEVGDDNIQGFQGELLSEACGGSGSGYFFLFLDKTTGHVSILLVYRYTE